MTPERLDVVVVGGGVIGLAVSRALAMAGREVVLLEAEAQVGTHTSARNSEVIHAGIYYPPGSLKARLCVAGREALYRYCAEHGVEHRRTGKVIVATREAELDSLADIRSQAEANGVTDLKAMSRADLRVLEPEVTATAGLWSPSTGIIDSHGLMTALRQDAEQLGAIVVSSSPVLGGRVSEQGVELSVGGADPFGAVCRTVINAAGLWAPQVAASISGLDPASVPRAYFAKGHYFTMSGPNPFRRLVYPVPVPGGLGTHVTLDLAGQVRFGPDVSWVDHVDYSFDEARAGTFYESIRRYFPGLADGALVPAYTGIRPKLAPAGGPNYDFTIQGEEAHGARGLINLFGIESPGLTSCLALADEVVSRVVR